MDAETVYDGLATRVGPLLSLNRETLLFRPSFTGDLNAKSTPWSFLRGNYVLILRQNTRRTVRNPWDAHDGKYVFALVKTVYTIPSNIRHNVKFRRIDELLMIEWLMTAPKKMVLYWTLLMSILSSGIICQALSPWPHYLYSIKYTFIIITIKMRLYLDASFIL